MTNILFICGSIEPGKDGVGDYTRMLAEGFVNHGHSAFIIAIHERGIPLDSISSCEMVKNKKIQTYRLSSRLKWSSRQKLLSQYVTQIDPAIISLQFVPFSFQDKGLPFFLSSWLSEISTKPRIWHIMFHELWVADSKVHSLKEWLLRESQKYIIVKLVKRLKFDLIDTSNPTYYNMLKMVGYESNIIPIFSNLPKGNSIMNDVVKKEGKVCVTAALFGKIHKPKSFSKKIEKLSKLIKKHLNSELLIIHIGGSKSSKTSDLLIDLSTKLNIEIRKMGFLDADKASNVLASADFGLSDYPVELVQKSGSIASMLYNELPVILLCEDKNIQSIHYPEISYLQDGLDFLAFINQKKNFGYKYSPEIAVLRLHKNFNKILNETGQG